MTVSIRNPEMEQIGVLEPGVEGFFETPSGKFILVTSLGWGDGFKEGRGLMARWGIQPHFRKPGEVTQIDGGFLVGI